jgi:competence ComEA-like helix-hairpin-helix protein|tara:strand:- start:4378 stop:5259 length:882 start_codon:yes stop_codon:yes gene_type:complete
MPKSNLQSHLIFSRSERGGILFLTALIVVLLTTYYCIDFSAESVLDVSSSEIVKQQRIIDSLYQVELEARKPKLYPFNPNFITDYKAYTLGMPTEAFDRLKAFRAQGKWINNTEDFRKVTGVSGQWIDSISPYFKFPAWVTRPKPNYTFSKIVNTRRSYDEKVDLNMATAEELQQVSGIGAVLSERIIAYRDGLGGFTDDVQLYEVYGLSSEVVQKTKQLFTVKSPKSVQKWNVNTASASDLSTIPGVSFDLAKEIWEFVRLREGITSLGALEKIEGITANKLKRIQLYLFVE